MVMMTVVDHGARTAVKKAANAENSGALYRWNQDSIDRI